jgi:hypothetical protein
MSSRPEILTGLGIGWQQEPGGLPRLVRTDMTPSAVIPEDHVVIPDLHGEISFAERVVERYGDKGVRFVFLGDIFDRKTNGSVDPERGVCRTMELIRSLGDQAVLLRANHELYALGALHEKNEELRRRKIAFWLGKGSLRIESNTLASYGVDADSPSAMEDFRQALQESGHHSLLASAKPYHETPRFIATHAGIKPEQNWDLQKATLRHADVLMLEGDYSSFEPPQWFSLELAADAQPVACTDRVVVSGHAHTVTGGKIKPKYPIQRTRERQINNRVRLATNLNGGKDPLLVWQDWDGKVVQFDRE